MVLCGQTPRPAADTQVRPPRAAPNPRIKSTRSYSLLSGRPDVAAPRDHLAALLIEGGHFLRIPTALIVSLGAAFCAAGLHADGGLWMHQQLRDGKKSPHLDVALGDVPVNFLSTVLRQVAIPDPPCGARANSSGSCSTAPTNPWPRTTSSTRHHALDSRGQPLHAVEHGGRGRRHQSSAGDGDNGGAAVTSLRRRSR